MEDYKIRVVHERAELYIKIIKLRKFTESDSFSILSDQDQLLLLDQLSSMNSYMEILDRRISAF